MAGALQRRRLNETSIMRPDGPDPRQIRPLQAIAWDTRRQRLVQSKAIMYILVGILSLVAIINVWAIVAAILIRRQRRRGGRSSEPTDGGRWLVDFEMRGLAPHGFSCIASMDALLHGSNYASITPEDAARMTRDELREHSVLGGSMFRMGWLTDARDPDKGVFTIGAVVDDDELEPTGEE